MCLGNRHCLGLYRGRGHSIESDKGQNCPGCWTLTSLSLERGGVYRVSTQSHIALRLSVEDLIGMASSSEVDAVKVTSLSRRPRSNDQNKVAANATL